MIVTTDWAPAICRTDGETRRKRTVKEMKIALRKRRIGKENNVQQGFFEGYFNHTET
jgi:hypothetical protein